MDDLSMYDEHEAVMHDLKPNCPACNEKLEFEGSMGSPGKGEFWSCPACKLLVIKVGTMIMKAEEAEPEDFELSPESVR